MRKYITYVIGCLFLINLLETKAQLIHYDQSIVLLHLPKVHSLKNLISPKVLQHYSYDTKAVEKTHYIDIEPLFKDTIGDKIYYFVQVYPETKAIDRRYTSGFLEQKSVSEALSTKMDSSLVNQNDCMLILKTEERFEHDVSIKQNDKNTTYYSIDNYYSVCVFKPGPFVLYPSEKTLEIPAGKLFLMEYDRRLLKKRIPFFNTADSYFKNVIDNAPVEEKYTTEHWTGNFIEGLANGKGIWSERNSFNSYSMTHWNIYAGNVEDNNFHGEGRYYHRNGLHAGKWNHGNFMDGQSWYTEVEFDTSSYYLTHHFIYGAHLLSTDFIPDAECLPYCGVKNPAYENFVIRDTLFPTDMGKNKAFQKSDLYSTRQSNSLIKMAFLLSSSTGSTGSAFFPLARYSTIHHMRVYFIVCKNNKPLILESDDSVHRYYDINRTFIVDYKYPKSFSHGLKQACDCK